MDKYKCNKCDAEFNNFNSLSRHSIRTHKFKQGEAYVDFYLNGVWPLCACGCGEKTKWSYSDKRFREFSAIGHLNRVRNNWGHNQKAIDSSSQTRREQYASGERSSWTTGLTKETDDRLKEYGRKISNKFTEDRKIKYSTSMKKMREAGTISTLYREKSSRWKGGVSLIQQIARSDKRLYDLWKYPILVRDGFKCRECPNTKDLHVHHNGESFSEIIKKVMTLNDYEKIDDFEIKKSVTDRVIDYHVSNKVSGETLCKECHNKLHPSLNF